MSLEIEKNAGVVTKDSLGDALSTILDKGLVIAGDISIHLVKTELLTIKIRLVLASVERAEDMGIDWWKHDKFLSGANSVTNKDGEVIEAPHRPIDEIIKGPTESDT